MPNVAIKRLVRKWEEGKWQEGRYIKSTLAIYKSKLNIGRETLYDNSHASALLFRARAGSLETCKCMAKFKQNSETCDLCGKGVEDIPHVLQECEALKDYRVGMEHTSVEQWLGFTGEEDEKDTIIKATKRMLGKWWGLKQQVSMRNEVD